MLGMNSGGALERDYVIDMLGKFCLLFYFGSGYQTILSWQSVRYKDICKEREKKEEALAKLTTREREIRKRIEDMLDPQNRALGETTSRGTTVKNENPNIELARQFLKRKYKGSERGRKRKAPTS
jgi:COMPASS component SPP1